MGVRLVGAAYHPHWSRVLTHTERVVLFAMALQALDTAHGGRPAELYFGGIDGLVIALYGDVADHETPAYRTQLRRLLRVVSRLIEARAIERVLHGHRGQRAVFRLTLNAHLHPYLPVDNS